MPGFTTSSDIERLLSKANSHSVLGGCLSVLGFAFQSLAIAFQILACSIYCCSSALNNANAGHGCFILLTQIRSEYPT